MEKFHFFYIGGMMLVSIMNGIQIGKGIGKAIVNWVQIIGSLFVLGYYFSMQLSGAGFTSAFFFWTTIYFVVYLVIEVVQNVKNWRMDYFRILSVCVSVAQVIYPVGLITGMF